MESARVQPKTILADVPYVAAGREPLAVIEPPEGTGDAQRNFGVDWRTISITNARQNNRPPTLDKEGFALVKYESSFHDFDSPEEIGWSYYPEAEQIVSQATGASHVLAFDHNIRVAGETNEHRKPAGIVHVDLTAKSARRIVNEQFPANEEKKLLHKRCAFINTWRPLTDPVFNWHLAFCDAGTVPGVSLLRAELRYVDRTGELYYCAYHDKHRWYYFPAMLPSEVLLLKNYDSASDGRARFTPHTAIEDATAPANAPARQSIEVRTMAFYE